MNIMCISERFASLLDRCSHFLSLKKLHALAFVSGFGNSSNLTSKIFHCYAKHGIVPDSRWVLNGYLNLKQLKTGFDGLTVTFCLKSCVASGRFKFGRRVHGDCFKFNLNSNCFVGSSIIGFYSKFGELEDACKVFEEITNKDIVAYTSMITAYTKFGDSCAYGAFRVAYRMQEQGLSPNRVTLTSLLCTATKLGALKEGRAIHGYAIRREIGLLDEIFETSLMDMYRKCGDVEMAASVFSKMDPGEAGSWNSLMVAYLHNGQDLEAFELFRLMISRKILPDLLTLANAILSCANLKFLLQGRSIHGYMIRMGIEPDLVASTALVDLFSKFDAIKARRMFDRLGKKDAIIYNVMMSVYLENELFGEVINLFHELVDMSINPNLASFLNLISAISNLRDVKLARSVHGYILRHELIMSVEIANQIINTYSKCGYILYAREVFNRMRYRDLVSWTTMMMCYVHHGLSDKAIILFRLMQRGNLKPDSINLISLLQALSQLGCLSSVKEVHCFIYRFFHGSEFSANNSLITTYAKCGRIDMARCLFEKMTELSVTSWNAMIAACGMHGNYNEALELFHKMKSGKVRPDEITFTSILTACSHSGLVEEGLQLFRTMVEEYAIVPCEVHYNCIVDLLSRAGQLTEAFNLVKSMPSTKSSAALSALLSGCRLYEGTEIGETIANQMLKLELRNSGSYALVSNLFAEGGRWDEVAKIRAMTKDKVMTNTAGCSLIEQALYQT
ncbi:putative tetratricopeptide-like helical domain-containing protein [Lupinus albus]|uniref:Putative tetratricopeptide-like helical domain-containing protein n=1 Tax=Lupinus albus TaxID=3870 RepID=A0A6A4QXI5_LUPAL|nr:putative tetratricopeptide-like helical domain-containing protein [Lupinus albus]